MWATAILDEKKNVIMNRVIAKVNYLNHKICVGFTIARDQRNIQMNLAAGAYKKNFYLATNLNDPHDIFFNLCCSELSDRPDDLQRNRGRILQRSFPSRLKILQIPGHNLCDISTAKGHQDNLTDIKSNFLYMDGR